jgi:DNA-binding transcriptional MerR regulator
MEPKHVNENKVDSSGEHLWPMGAVTRRTGIGEHTLRAWERRFGFPNPKRLASGHRRYPAAQVQQLLLIQEALSGGYRAGDVVPLSREELEELLREAGRDEALIREPTPQWMQRVLDAARKFDQAELSAQLNYEASTLGVGTFLRDRVAPMLVEIGDAWVRGDLQIRHEHFISEALEDVLRSLRTPLEASAAGRPVVMANLPNEFHELGLQIAAVAIAAAGRTVRILGRNTPEDEIVETAISLDAAAVGVSISAFGITDTTGDLVTSIRRQLPSRTRLWLGGGGAGRVENLPMDVQILDSLDDLERAVRGLRD